MWYKNKMFKKNKKTLDKCSLRAYYCGVRTKQATQQIVLTTEMVNSTHIEN